MEFILYFQKTALYMAIENDNVEIVKALLSDEYINPNIKYISSNLFVIQL